MMMMMMMMMIMTYKQVFSLKIHGCRNAFENLGFGFQSRDEGVSIHLDHQV